MEGVHHYAGVRDALRGVLPFVGAEAESELIGESVPAALRAPRGPCGMSAHRAAADQAHAWGVGGGLGDVHRVVDPDGAVEGLRAEATPWGRASWAAGSRVRLLFGAGVGARPRRARKRWMQRMSTLSGDPALRWPKCAAAKRPMKPSMQKPLIALSQSPRHVKGRSP